MELKSLAYTDLVNRRFETETLLKAIQAEIEIRKQQETASAIARIHEIAASVGASVQELLGESPSAYRKRKAPAGAKYEHPTDSSKTWNGLGRRPRWATEYVESGKLLQDLEIKR